MTHTPGKWETDGCTIYSGGNILAATYCEGNRSLHSNLDDKDTPPDSDGKHGHGWEEAWKNARLMAAAPELLAALQLVYANAGESPEWIRARIGSAISKAEGKA